MNLFTVYRDYPFTVPIRVRFFNFFRLIFRLTFLERFLANRIHTGGKYWVKLIPPLYFYPEKSMRNAERYGVLYLLDLSKQLEHSIYFSTIRDDGWGSLLGRVSKDFTVVDIGANIGYLTIQFAIRANEGVIHAFEPDSENFRKLSHNVAINELKNVRIYKTALGSRPGSAELYRLYKSNPGTNRILPERPQRALSSEAVKVETLDAYESRGCFPKGVDLIKVDVEGFELFVLQGACNIILRYRPLLFIELIDENLRPNQCSGQAVIEYVSSFGYKILDAKTMGPLATSDRYYTDIICFPVV